MKKIKIQCILGNEKNQFESEILEFKVEDNSSDDEIEYKADDYFRDWLLERVEGYWEIIK